MCNLIIYLWASRHNLPIYATNRMLIVNCFYFLGICNGLYWRNTIRHSPNIEFNTNTKYFKFTNSILNKGKTEPTWSHYREDSVPNKKFKCLICIHCGKKDSRWWYPLIQTTSCGCKKGRQHLVRRVRHILDMKC